MGTHQPASAAPESRLSFGDILTLTLWLGLAYGLLEGALLLGLYELSGLVMWRNGVGPAILWVAPVVNAALFVAGGLGLAALLRVSRLGNNSLARAFTFALLFGVAAFGLAMAPRALNTWGCAAFAVGAAVQAFRTGRAGSGVRFFRRTLGAVIAVTVVVGAGAEVWIRWRETQFLASLPAAAPDRPNVLLMVLDTVRADHLSSYGYPRETTPNLDRLAKEGVLFERAYSTYTWTLPSHLAIMSGLQVPDRLRWDSKYRELPTPLLSELLAREGYATVACVANNMWCTPKSGLGKGFARYNVYFHSPADMFSRTFYGKKLATAWRWLGYYDTPGRKTADQVNRELLEWIDQVRPSGRPFFAMLNYFDAHQPYAPPPPFAQKFSPRVTRANLMAVHDFGGGIRSERTAEDVQLLTDAYDSSLAYLDHTLGALREELEKRGALDNTVIIVTADHGESLGEENVFDHVGVLRQEVSRVPLILRYPARIAAGQRVSTPVSLRRIAATVADVLKLGERSPYTAPSLLDRDKDARQLVVVLGGGCAIISHPWHVIVRRNRPAKLYNLEDDPQQKRDLAESPEGQTVRKTLVERLASSWPKGEPPPGCLLPPAKGPNKPPA